KAPPKPDPYVRYKLEAGIHDILYVAFKRQESGEVTLESAVSAAGPSGTNYLPGGGGECHADADARAILVQEALARIRSVQATYLSSPQPDKGDVLGEVNIAGHDPVRTFYNREMCRKSLDACVDASEIKDAAAAEIEKLK